MSLSPSTGAGQTPPESKQLRSTLLRLDELLGEVDSLSPRDVGRWTLAMDARLASLRRLAAHQPDVALDAAVTSYEALVDEVLTKLAESASALARLTDYVAGGAPESETEQLRDGQAPQRILHRSSRKDLLELRELRDRLEELLERATQGSIPRSGPVKGEWVNSVNAALAAVRRRAGEMPAVELKNYETRVRAQILALGRPVRKVPARRVVAADGNTASPKRESAPAVTASVPDHEGGEWKLVGRLWHRVRKGRLMYCGVIVGDEAKRRSRTAGYCRECVERGEAGKDRGRVVKRARMPRVWIVSGGAPGLGKR